MDTDRLIELLRQDPVLEALRAEGAMDRQDLESHLDVSRSTVHRFTRSLRDSGLIKRVNNEFVLTPFGETSAEAIAAFGSTIETARELAPILESAVAHDIRVDLEAFEEATVTTAAPGDPYRPVKRFMSLLEATDTLRGLDPASINPMHVDELAERIVEGMETEAVYPTAVAEGFLTSYPERSQAALESGNLTLLVHDDLPFGLTLCDDRVGVGVYDDDTGLLRTYADTDAPAAREWAEAVYADYRAEATPATDDPELASVQAFHDG